MVRGDSRPVREGKSSKPSICLDIAALRAGWHSTRLGPVLKGRGLGCTRDLKEGASRCARCFGVLGQLACGLALSALGKSPRRQLWI